MLPLGADAATYSEEKTEALLRAVVAYNKYHVRRVMREDTRWFKGWQDVPVHEHQPLAIRKPDSKDDLLTYVSPWNKREAVISFKGTGTYKAGGNVFWLNPFVDGSPKMSSIAGDPPLYSACLDAAETYALTRIQQEAVKQGTESAAQEARIKFPHVFTTFQYQLKRVRVRSQTWLINTAPHACVYLHGHLAFNLPPSPPAAPAALPGPPLPCSFDVGS